MRIKFYLALLGALFTCLQTYSQQIQLLDIYSNRPVSRAIVYSEARTTMLTSKADGSVDISSLLPCDSLMVQHAAYTKLTIASYTLDELGNIIYLERSVVQMPTFEIKAAREAFIDSPTQTRVLEADEIAAYQPRTTADMLERTGEVFIQRSQLGGGSPVLRGFEANRILLMVDGVRLNNAIYRSGHLQNAISVDPFILDRSEVKFGPGSIVYGSDALGGVIHFHTRTPELASGDEPLNRVEAAQRFSTSTQENATHFDFATGNRKLASLSSVTRTEYGNMRMGRNRMHGDADWGLLPQFVERIDGTDVVVDNDAPWVIPNAGYEQYDVLQKFLWRPIDSLSIIANIQYSTTSDVPRSDQLAERRDGELRFAEWNYGPQERFLASVQLDHLSSDDLYDKASIIVALQRIGEDRITRNLGSDLRSVRQEDVEVFSINADLVKRLKKNKDLYYGAEVVSNIVSSTAFVNNIVTSERFAGATRYPDGGSSMNTLAAYLNLSAVPSERLRYDLGIRYSHIYLDGRFIDTAFYTLPFQSVLFDNGALTGSAGLTYSPTQRWDIGLSAATGFRSPNVDDFGKVFERAGIVVVPTDELKPEYTINGEVRLKRTSLDKQSRIEIAGFYTHILDAITQVPSTLGGSDSLLYDGDWATINVNSNAKEAYIVGLSAGLSQEIGPYLTGSATASYTYGRVVTTDVPLAHIAPFFAKADLTYRRDDFSLGCYVLYNDTKQSKFISPGRTDNPDQGLNGAFPSWYTLHFTSRVKFNERISLSINLDNITDVHYKAFASGISAPGRNLSAIIRMSL